MSGGGFSSFGFDEAGGRGGVCGGIDAATTCFVEAEAAGAVATAVAFFAGAVSVLPAVTTLLLGTFFAASFFADAFGFASYVRSTAAGLASPSTTPSAILNGSPL